MSKLFLPPCEKGSSLKRKNLPSFGANSFRSEEIPFQKGFRLQKSKQEVTKVVSLVKYGRITTTVPSP